MHHPQPGPIVTPPSRCPVDAPPPPAGRPILEKNDPGTLVLGLEGAGAPSGEAYAWAIENPGKVTCLYAVNPIMRSTMTDKPIMDNLKPLAEAGVKLVHLCGSLDPMLDSQTREVQKRYEQLGGQFQLVLNEGKGHYPLEPASPDDIVAVLTSPTGK